MLARLKLEFDELIGEMLDQLPESVWASETTTFFDPAFAGGQFVREIERRLREHGHSDENIAGRVSGYEANIGRVRFAKGRHNLVGKYEVGNFLEETGVKKFDVIVGNPPYQDSRAHGKKTTGNGALWVKFTVKAMDLINDNGVLGFVIPDSWTAPTYDLMGSRKSIFTDYFKKHNLFYLNFDVKKFFPNVGIDPSVFVLKKGQPYTKTVIKTPTETISLDLSNMSFITKDLSPVSLSIHSKVLSHKENSRLIKMRWKKTVTSIKIQETKDSIFKYPFVDPHSYKPLRWASTLDPDAPKRKVLVPYVGKYQCIVDNIGELGARESVSVLFLNDNEKGEYAERFFASKLVNYIMNTNQWTQYQLSQILNFIPIEDFSQDWNDQKIYKHFNLTQEEIDYIESHFDN
jgi:hypothetical protein